MGGGIGCRKADRSVSGWGREERRRRRLGRERECPSTKFRLAWRSSSGMGWDGMGWKMDMEDGIG